MLTQRHHITRSKGDEILVMLAERDCDDPLLATGGIIFEQYTNVDPEDVLERAKSFADAGKYGQIWVARLEDITAIPPKKNVYDQRIQQLTDVAEELGRRAAMHPDEVRKMIEGGL